MNVIMSKISPIIVLFILHIPVIKAYASKNSIHSNKCGTALSDKKKQLSTYFEAIDQGDLKTFLTFNSIDWDISTKHEAGQELLFHAAQVGKVEFIKALISKIGIDVNSADENEWTPLHYAALNLDILSRTDTIYALVQLGANVDATDHLGHKPSDHVRKKVRYMVITEQQGYKAIYLTLATDNILEIADLLQINYGVLSGLVQDFRTNNDLQVH